VRGGMTWYSPAWAAESGQQQGADWAGWVGGGLDMHAGFRLSPLCKHLTREMLRLLQI